MSGIRIGQGIDAHRFREGRKLILAGVEVPHDKGLLGHSDADVAAHAAMDAVLGALALGDIGAHFPPGDELYKDADSLELAARVAEMAAERGYAVSQLDVTIVAERPKIGPYAERMRANLAKAFGADMDMVSVKATTTEGMGFTGAGEGIAALAVALLQSAK